MAVTEQLVSSTMISHSPSINYTLSITMTLLVLSATDVSEAVQDFTPDLVVSLMANVFVDLAVSRDTRSVIIPHRSSIISQNHNILFMPSRLPSFGTAIKIVSVPTPTASADVKARGLPASTAIIDETTGEIAALVNARKLTALRNAASMSYIPNIYYFTFLYQQVPFWPLA